MRTIRVDRHLLASPAGGFDTAWTTFGATPALAGARAGRLEERVPWGSLVTRMDDPPRLLGPVEDVVAPDNLDRLGRAFLSLDGRLAWSMWGATGQRDEDGWRAATHTLLLDAPAFRALAGWPEGLLGIGGDGGDGAAGGPELPPWFLRFLGASFQEPVPLEAVEAWATPDVGQRMAARRAAEVRRLRDRLVALGVDVEEELAAVLEALARVWAGEARHVGLPAPGDGSRVCGPSLLARLAWLVLPVDERLSVFLHTAPRRAGRPPAHLLVLPEQEWGSQAPADALVPGGEGWPERVSDGRRWWARVVAEQGVDGRLAARMEVRRWRLLDRDDLAAEAASARWRTAWRREGPTVEAAAALARREAAGEGRGRLRAAGRALADAVGAASAAGWEPGPVLDALEPLSGDAAAAVLSAAVSRLRRKGPEERRRGGLLRAAAARRDPESTAGRDLVRLVDAESDTVPPLFRDPRDAAALLDAALARALMGDSMAAELALIAVVAAELEPLPDRLASERGWDGEAGRALAPRLLVRAAGERGDPEALEALAGVLLPRCDAPGLEVVLARAAAPGREDLAEAALVESARRGDRSLDGPAAAALSALADRRPPERDPHAWEALLSRLPDSWLARPAVMAAVVDVFEAGRHPAVPDGRADRVLAAAVAARVLPRLPPTPSADEAVLRLLWHAASTGPLDRALAELPPGDRAPLLERLRSADPPLPLLGILESRLATSGAGGPGGSGPASRAPTVALVAP